MFNSKKAMKASTYKKLCNYYNKKYKYHMNKHLNSKDYDERTNEYCIAWKCCDISAEFWCRYKEAFSLT